VPALAATVVLGGGGAALGLAVGGTNGTSGGTATPQITPFAAPIVLSTAPVIDPTPSVAAAPTARAAHSRATAKQHPRPTDTLRLVITGSASYVQVRTWNDHLLIARVLHHDQRLAFRQHGLRVTLGNAGAVRLTVAGHRARVAGRPGEVRHFQVN
jgi:hypothetical protein